MTITPGLATTLRCSPLRRSITSLLIVTFLLSPYGVLATPVPDVTAPVAQQPTVAMVGAVPVVAIAAPNAAGLSHNKYTGFDVPAAGVVLNNATTATTSILAGAIAGNPNFSGAAASVILNEVTGSASSLLAGPMEVAGSPAKLILANPNGITCDGCGFINTPHVQLTTGRPQWESDQLRFDVLNGTVSIGPSGLTALATRLDLIGRQIKVEGAVSAGELNLLAGRAYVEAETTKQTVDEEHILRSSPSAGLTQSGYLIDVSQSLSAGTVRLVVSPDRYAYDQQGIRATAAIHADQDLLIHGNTGMQISDISAGRNVSVLSLTLRDVLIKNATAGDTLQVVAELLTIPEDGFWHAGNDIQIGNLGISGDGWGRFDNYGRVEAGRDLVLAFGADGQNNNHGTLSADRDVFGGMSSVVSDSVDPDSGITSIVANGSQASFELHPEIQARNQDAWTAWWWQGPLDSAIRGDGAVSNSRADGYPAGRIEAGHDAHLVYGDRSTFYGPNGDGGIIVAGNDIHLWSRFLPGETGVDVPAGFVTAARDLYLHDLPYYFDTTLRLASWGQKSGLSNDRLSAGRDVLFLPDSNSEYSRQCFANPYQISAGRDIVVRADIAFINAGGSLDAGGNIAIQAAAFTNTAGIAAVEGISSSPRHPGCRTDNDGHCRYADETYRLPGNLTAGGDIAITAATFDNNGGRILADGNIDIRTNDFANHSRVLSSVWTGSYYEPEDRSHSALESGPGGSSGSGLEAGPLPLVLHTVTGTTANIGEVSAVIQAGGRFTVAGLSTDPIITPTPDPSPDPATPTPDPADPAIPAPVVTTTPSATAHFVNTGHIGAGTIVIRADELRNGFDPVADFYRTTALPTTSPFTLNEAVDGGQMIAEVAMVIDGKTVTNTGYLASGGILSVSADALWNGHRNADYHEVRKVKGGKLYIDGDTVQPGGAMAAGAFDLQVNSLTSRSGEFIVVQDTPEATQAASSAFLAKLTDTLGEDYHFSTAEDHLTSDFKAKKKSGFGGLVGIIVAVVVSYFTVGLASTLIANAATTSTSIWATSGLANVALSQGIASVASSAAGQWVSTGEVNWNNALKAGLTAGITSGLTNVQLDAFGGQSLNQLANIKTVAGTVVADTFNADAFAGNLLAMAGRGIVSAGVSSAINDSSFADVLRNSLVNDLAAVGANAIGQGLPESSPENILAHAGLGCAAASATGADCEAGAVGAAASALLNPLIDPLTTQEDGTARTLEHLVTTMLVSGLAADALGLDPVTAAQAAQNETVNNYLSPKQIKLKREELAGADTEAKRQEIATRYAALDAQQRDAAAACLLESNCTSVMDPVAIKAVLDELQVACSVPKICSPEAIAGLAELNGIYNRTDAIEAVGPVEEAMAWIYGGKLAGTGLSALWGRIAGGTVEAGAKGLPPLRQAYVEAVSELKPMADSLRAAGADAEAIARAMHAERRAIGEQFKTLTPTNKLAEIHERNLQRYGDKLGPSVNWLRTQGKSWDQIVESATRTGGKDLGF